MKKTFLTLMTILAVIPAFSQSKTVKALSEGKEQTIAIYGTSVCRNVGGKAWVEKVNEGLGKAYAGKATIYNCGGIGKNSIWGLENLQDSVIVRNPDMVILEWATNDAVTRFKITPEKCKQNVLTMISRIHEANPKCEIYLLVCTGNPIEKALETRPDIDAYNDVYRAVAKEQKTGIIDIAPLYKELYQKVGDDTFKNYSPDGVHCTRKGAYYIFAPKILNAITGDPKYKVKF